jgi:Glycosyl transferase family 2
MSTISVSWILPAQETIDLTLAMLSHVRDRSCGLRSEIILIDRPSASDLGRSIPGDVLLVRAEHNLPGPRLLYAGILASRGEIIVWCPRADWIPAGDLVGSINYVSRRDVFVLPTYQEPCSTARSVNSNTAPDNCSEFATRFKVASSLTRLRLRLSRECFLSRRTTALKAARGLCSWGDLPVFTAVLLTAMRLPLSVDRGLVSDRVQSLIRTPRSEAADELPGTTQGTVRRPQVDPLVSVIITAHNEGAEVLRTVESVEANTRAPVEFVVVDDGSTDGCCDNLNRPRLRVIRHDRRVGVAYSRNAGASLARGDVLAFLDGHQRVSAGCLDCCTTVAISRDAIVWPDVRALHNRTAIGHGAFFRLGAEESPFTAKWNNRRFGQRVAKITSLCAPGYLFPRKLFNNLRWISQLRGWGGTEATIALKAFFLGVDILHVCGPVARHLFRREFQYPVRDAEIARNHALIARICFDDRTWFEHWLPRVFEARLSPDTRRELESAEVVTEHREFVKLKRRPDHEFWRGLVARREPDCLRTESAAVALPSAVAQNES